MRVTLHPGAGRLLVTAERFLREDPFSANVISVIASRIANGGQPDDDRYLWATVEGAGGQVVGLAMQTPPHGLFVSRMPAEAAHALADRIAGAGRDLPGVNGAVESTEAFAQAWIARTGRTSRVVTAMRMYRLDALARPIGVPGKAGVAVAPDDIEVVGRWLGAFHDEALPHSPSEDWLAYGEQRIVAGQIHLWYDDGAPVSFAAVSAAAAGVARIGPVYTPPSSRRRGYGAAVTAEAQAAGADHVALYTNLANPTSNSIYQAIGYRPDHDADERAFS